MSGRTPEKYCLHDRFHFRSRSSQSIFTHSFALLNPVRVSPHTFAHFVILRKDETSPLLRSVFSFIELIFITARACFRRNRLENVKSYSCGEQLGIYVLEIETFFFFFYDICPTAEITDNRTIGDLRSTVARLRILKRD